MTNLDRQVSIKIDRDNVGTPDACNICPMRFTCYTTNPYCAAPYSDDRLRKWMKDYPAVERGVIDELAHRKVQREIAEIHENIIANSDKETDK